MATIQSTLGKALDQDIDDTNSTAIEDNRINKDIVKDYKRSFQDDLWPENNLEEFSSEV